MRSTMGTDEYTTIFVHSDWWIGVSVFSIEWHNIQYNT